MSTKSVKLNDNERSALRIIKRWQEHYSNSPTISELAQEMGIHYWNAQYALNQLSDKGYIELMSPAGSRRLLIKPLYWE